MYDDHLAPSGLRATQFPILMVVDELGEVPVNDVATRLDLDRTAAGRALRALEVAGHLEMTRSGSDGRSRNASLTSRGRQVLEVAKPLWRQAQAALEHANGRDVAIALRTTLAGLVTDDGSPPADPAGRSATP